MKLHRFTNAAALGLAMTMALMVPAGVARAEVHSSPLALEGAYTSDSFANLHGGLKTGVRVMGKLSILADADLSVMGLAGATFHADVQYVHGKSLSGDLVGDAQVVSNIDAISALRPMEAYVSFPFGAQSQGEVKAGLIDLNADFDVQEVGAFFLNSSHGIGPDFAQSGANGPSIFPTSASAITLQWREEGWSARLGLFDAVAGDPDHPKRTVVRFPGTTGLLIVGEVDFSLTPDALIQLGAWHYTPRFEALDAPDTRSNSRGAYGMIQGVLARRGEAELGAWLRAGMAADRVNPVGTYLGGGATFGTDERKLGLAIAHARLGDPARAMALSTGAPANRAETAIELSYAHQVHERIRVQPDLHYVINPGWDPALDNALVAGLRIELSLF